MPDMKLLAVVVLATVALATPALAQNRTATPAVQARTAVAGPVAVRPVDRPDEPNWGQINRQLNARAKNAVENGADPAVVRQKLHEYKQHLRRRWNAANGN
jgi:enoyl reductase-like protein